MFHILFAVISLTILVILMTAGVVGGKKYGRWYLHHHKEKKPETVKVAEGTVFALLGLLIAFTFSGAYDRFEVRKMHVIDEANAYETAYLRIDLLAPQTREPIKQQIKKFVDTRLGIYKLIPDFHLINQELNKSATIKLQIWNLALAACQITNKESTTELLIPALNDMFDQSSMGFDMAYVHSPPFIFFLLIVLAVLGAFLTGYSIAASKNKHSLHVISYIAISSLTIFLIINLEVPRIGIMRIDSFDKVLQNMRNQWDVIPI